MIRAIIRRYLRTPVGVSYCDECQQVCDARCRAAEAMDARNASRPAVPRW